MPQARAYRLDELTPVSAPTDGTFRLDELMPADGLVTPGNIDLTHRPRVKNADGTVSTVRSMSFNQDGREILVPTISDDGRVLSNDDAIRLYQQTGRHLGIFDTPDHATAYAQRLHEQQAASLRNVTNSSSFRISDLTPVDAQATRPGWLSRTWSAVTRPVPIVGPWISGLGRSVASAISAPGPLARAVDAVTAAYSMATPVNPTAAVTGAPRGFAAGAAEGAGDLLASMTSPANLLMVAGGVGGEAAAARNLTRAARALRVVEGAGGAAFGVEGAHTVATAPTLEGKLAGIGEMAGGLAGVMHAGGVKGPSLRLPWGRDVAAPIASTFHLSDLTPATDAVEPPVTSAAAAAATKSSDVHAVSGATPSSAVRVEDGISVEPPASPTRVTDVRAAEPPPSDAPAPRTFGDLPAVERREVRRILAELNEFKFEQLDRLDDPDLGTRAHDDNPLAPPRLPNATAYREINATQRRTGGQIRAAIERYVAGKAPTAITQDVVRVARDRAYRRLNIEGPWQLPPEAGDVAGDYVVTREHAGTPLADVEARAADTAERNPAALRAEYFQEHGNVINADLAREFLAKRANIDDPHAPERYRAMKNSVSAFSDSLYDDVLSQPTPAGKAHTIVLTGGGTGSGKSAVTDAIRQHVHAVFDSTLSNPTAARRLINQAINHGFQVDIRFVYRDPVEAFRDGVISRYVQERRPVPIDDHVGSHTRAANTLIELVGEYSDNPNVTFTPILNRTDQASVEMDSADLGAALARYHEPDALRSDLRAALQGAVDGGTLSEHDAATLAGAATAARPPQIGDRTGYPEGRRRLAPSAEGPQAEVLDTSDAGSTGQRNDSTTRRALPWGGDRSTVDAARTNAVPGRAVSALGVTPADTTPGRLPFGPRAAEAPAGAGATSVRKTWNIRELHGGVGAVGRVTTAGEARPVEPAPAPRRRTVQTFDPASISEPAPPATPMGETQRLEGIGLKSFDASVRPALREVLETHHGFAEQRRNVQTWERTRKLSEHIAVDVATVPKGRVLNAEETTAFANTLATLTDRIAGLADRARRGELDDVGRLSLEEARAAQASVMQSVWGTVTEQGRALNAWKAAKRVLDSHDATFIREALAHLDQDEGQLATVLEQVGDDPVKQYAWLKSQARERRSVASTLASYYYSNILSGVATHERNVLSNSSNLLFGTMADVASGRIGEARASLSGMWDALSERRTPTGPYALALPRAFQEVYFNLTRGFSPTDVHTGKLDFGRIEPEFAGGGRNPFNWPGRALNAADGFFRALVNQGERYRAAYRLAKGRTGSTLETRMADALADLPLDVLREIDEMTARAVFQETPGKTTRAFLQLRETVPGLRYVVPFVRIAANLTRQGVEFSPVGFAMKSARRAGRVGEAARAKAAMGTVALLPIAYYAAMGRITGSGPADPGERQAWLDSGKRPNSILNPLTGEWVNYASWQPVALPMSVVANLIEAYRDAEGQAPRRTSTTSFETDPGSQAAQREALDYWTAIAGQAVLRTTNSVLQQSFLSGVSSLLDALNDPERSAQRFFTSLAQGFVPMSGAMRTATQVVDPVVRTPASVREGVNAIIPGRSTTVAPLVDRFGHATTGTGNPLVRGFYQASPSKPDVLQPLLDYADVTPQRPSKTLRDQGRPIALTRDEQTALQMARGRARRAAYEQVRGRYGDTWGRLPSEALNDELTRTASRAETRLTARAKQLKASGQTLTLAALGFSEAQR